MYAITIKLAVSGYNREVPLFFAEVHKIFPFRLSEVALRVLAYGAGKAGSTSKRVIEFCSREEWRKAAGENSLLTRSRYPLMSPE